MPGPGQGTKAQRRNNPAQKICASVPLALKLSFLGIIVDFFGLKFALVWVTLCGVLNIVCFLIRAQLKDLCGFTPVTVDGNSFEA